MNCVVKSRHYVKRKVKRYKKGHTLFTQLLGQQAHRAGTADVLDIADIATDVADIVDIVMDIAAIVDIVADIVSIADVANIADIADRMLQILQIGCYRYCRYCGGVYKVSQGCPVTACNIIYYIVVGLANYNVADNKRLNLYMLKKLLVNFKI